MLSTVSCICIKSLLITRASTWSLMKRTYFVVSVAHSSFLAMHYLHSKLHQLRITSCNKKNITERHGRGSKTNLCISFFCATNTTKLLIDVIPNKYEEVYKLFIASEVDHVMYFKYIKCCISKCIAMPSIISNDHSSNCR